jgi:hypothetical protein
MWSKEGGWSSKPPFFHQEEEQWDMDTFEVTRPDWIIRDWKRSSLPSMFGPSDLTTLTLEVKESKEYE